MDIYSSRGTPGFPSFGHRYCPTQSLPAHGVSKKVIWYASMALGPYPSSYLCAPRPSISLTLDLIAVPPSPTSPSPTQAPSTALMIYGEPDHAPTCVYCLLSFPICQLGSDNITPSHCSFPDGPLNPPSSSPPLYPRRHVFVASIAPSTSLHHFSSSSKHHPRSIIIYPQQTTGPSYSLSASSTCTLPATRNEMATAAPATLTSTSTNAAATMTHQVSLD